MSRQLIHYNNCGDEESDKYEYCRHCDANLTLQRGFSNKLAYWKCLGCGVILVNPEIDDFSGVAWICDNCDALLNAQPGFDDECGEWICTECGTANAISEQEIYVSDDEYQADLHNPYKGISDEDICRLAMYNDEKLVGDSDNVILVRHCDTGELYIKKLLIVYDKSIYEYLKENPIDNMPRIIDICEGSNCLIIIEEYIVGETVAERLSKGSIPEKQAIHIAYKVCELLQILHSQPTPIIHRDVKPSNIMLSDDGSVYLIDMDVAKWYSPNKNDDTRYMGTENYAAPEQVGFGFESSSPRTDIYAVGILLNVMLTGKFPKEEKADGIIWDVIEKCISLEADKRYTADELILELECLAKTE